MTDYYNPRERLDAARRWAAANASDPFALTIALHYIKRNPKPTFNKEGQPTEYDAEEFYETRVLPDGTKYKVIAYRNLVRP